MLFSAIAKVPKLTIQELLVIGQLRWVCAIATWKQNGGTPEQVPERQKVMLKFAMDFQTQCDPQAVRLLSGMVMSYGKPYPKTTDPATLCLWDYWCELVLGSEHMCEYQFRMPPEMRAALESEHKSAGLTVVNTKNNIKL